jgi:GR25 family glycosyltransferase involved in LPS biosynthesis
MEIININCKIISVNVKDEQDSKSVQDFGHQKDNLGEKLRYIKRREKIDGFLNSFNSDIFNIEYFNAITPNNFTLGDLNINYNDKKIPYAENSFFYMANTLSHYEIWNIDEDTLVLEDDVIFDNEVFNNLSNIITEFKSIQSVGKILYLQISTPWLKDADEKQIHSQKLSDNIGKYLAGDISGTSAYYITKECKKVILDNIKPFIACDRYLELFVRDGLIEYYVPLSKDNMFKLDTNTMWL